jgi:uncharacterized membrane protein
VNLATEIERIDDSSDLGGVSVRPDKEKGRARTYPCLLLVAVILRLWVASLGSSLWLDETGTFWVIQHGFSHIYSRALLDMVSPAYSAIAWGFVSIAGPREFIFRLPSAIALGVAAFLLYRLCARLFDRETGLLAALVFVCLPSVSLAATYARSYGVALLVSVAATLMLVRWVESGRLRDALAYILLGALTVYFHYLFATTLAIHAVYALQHLLAGGRVRLWTIIFAAFLIGLLLVPLIPYVHSLYMTRAIHSWAPQPQLDHFFEALLPTATCSALLLGALAARLVWSGFRLRPFPLTQSQVVLLGAWVILPPALLFVVARFSHSGLFLPRYYLPMTAGFAILAAWAIRAIEPIEARLTVATAVALASILAYGGVKNLWISHGDDDWKSAMRAVNSITSTESSVPVLFHTGFVEADDFTWLADPERRSLMVAPLSFYPATGNMIPLPYTFNPKSQAYTEEKVSPLLERGDRFLFVTKGPDSRLFESWLRYRSGPAGFSYRSLGDFGAVSVFLFERNLPN